MFHGDFRVTPSGLMETFRMFSNLYTWLSDGEMSGEKYEKYMIIYVSVIIVALNVTPPLHSVHCILSNNILCHFILMSNIILTLINNNILITTL